MACPAVIGDANSCLAVVIPVGDIGSSSDIHCGRDYSGALPRYFYEGKDVCAVDGSLRCRLFDLGRFQPFPNRLVTDKK